MAKILVLLFLAAAAAMAAYYFLFRNPPAAEKLAKLQKEVQPKSGQVFETVLGGQPRAFLLLGCKVYLLDTASKTIRREKVLEPGFYLGFTTCTSQTIKPGGEYVLVYLAQQALGAGGGNVGGGNYRSKDGRDWEKHTEKGWLPVSEAQ